MAIVAFFGAKDGKAHDDFQTWRRGHRNGYFVNCKSSKLWMLHRVECDHHGDTEFGAAEGGILTKRRKLCSEDKAELIERARQENAKLLFCNDCEP